MAHRTLDADVPLGPLIDSGAAGPRRFLIPLICFLILTADGYDVAIAVQTAPLIAQSFGVTSATLMGAIAAQTASQSVGAFLLSPLADRYGRQVLLLGCLTVFAVATVLSVLVRDLFTFTLVRCVVGLVAGALTPIAVSHIADTAPLKLRSTFVGIAYAGLSVGILLATAVVGWLVEPFGWKVGFWIGGFAPLVLAGLVLIGLPESPRHLARRNPADPRLPAALRAIGIRPPDTVGSYSVEATPKGERIPILPLFRGGRAPLTLLLWLASILSLTGLAFKSLLPTFYHELAGVPVAVFAKTQSLAAAGSLAAALIAGMVADRVGAYTTLFGFAVFSAVCVLSLAFVPFGATLFPFLLVAAAVTQTGAQASLNILSPSLYPARMRAAAVGWKGGMGKLGSSLAPFAGAAILVSGAGILGALGSVAALLLLVALCAPALAFFAARTTKD